MQSDRHITLKCGSVLRLNDLEAAGISYVPCTEEQPLLAYSEFWGDKRQVTLKTFGKKANPWTLNKMTGVQVMTGAPTYLRGVAFDHYLTDIDIEKHLIETYPETLEQIVTHYRDNCTGTPCIVQTKSGGLRLSAFCQYLEKKQSFDDEEGMLLEIFSKKGLSRLDHRYAMVEGSILEIPILPEKALQTIYGLIADLQIKVKPSCQPSTLQPTRQSSDTPKPQRKKRKRRSKRKVVSESQIGELTINWGADGRSQYFSSRHCRATSHKSDTNTVRWTKHKDGSIDGKCFNCGETWWEIPPKRTSVQKLIEQAPPPIELNTPSFRHWTPEERIVVQEVMGLSPDAGWHDHIPAFATKYENLYRITGEFALNGQPTAVEKRRVWSTQFGTCDTCGGITADWMDRYLLTAGRYCNTCHTDTLLGSYLQWELARKLPNSIVSEYQGFLGDDPAFEDFRLWSPNMLTHLGAGMSTGKSTEIYKALVAIAMQQLGVGIIATPRISVARFLAHQLRKRHGHQAWGLWHEGSEQDQFIGTYGAIVCVPSLARTVSAAYAQGLDASSLYVAIDEIDFGYRLLSLAVQQAAAVKKCLLDIFTATGLVVSGQTESTLALEAFAAEIGGLDNLQAFYNTAPPAQGFVELRKYPAVEGKSAHVVAGAIESIEAAVADGHNVYVFCTSRRDADIVAERFTEENPIVYNAYTKGDPRCDAVLKNQGLPADTCLFIGTSAAGVGISILDPKAKTIIIAGLNHGSRDTSMLVQKAVRDRGRQGVEIHYTDYTSALPIRPREGERVSLYHEEVKLLENQYAHLSKDAVKRVATSMALGTLADHQLETFVRHHLGDIGNMQVVETHALPPADTEIEWVTEYRRESIQNERESKCQLAVDYLRGRELYTTREIRVMSNNGGFTQPEQLAHEYANGLARAVGWDDRVDRTHKNPFDTLLNADMISIATQLATEHIQPDRLEKIRRGYLAVHYPKWVTAVFHTELEATRRDLLETGAGVELTAVTDDRFLGVVLKTLLERLTGEIFEGEAHIATAIREVLDTVHNGQTIFGRIQAGGLGIKGYRRGRFLHIGGDQVVIGWARRFIKEYYPATLSKRGDNYALVHDKRMSLMLESFRCWLSQRVDGELAALPTCFEAIAPHAEQMEQVRARRKEGATLENIAAAFGIALGTASEWCKDITPNKETVRRTAAQKRGKKRERQEAARARRRAGATIEEISLAFAIGLATAHRWCKDVESTE